MPITISYDLKQATPNDHNRIRSALETFGWEGLGGSTFRFSTAQGSEEDWLNKVIPSLMLFRSYLVEHGLTIKFFTLDTQSVSRIDQSAPGPVRGYPPVSADKIKFDKPKNKQAGLKWIKRFIKETDSQAGKSKAGK